MPYWESLSFSISVVSWFIIITDKSTASASALLVHILPPRFLRRSNDTHGGLTLDHWHSCQAAESNLIHLIGTF